MYRHILVAIDNSEITQQVFDTAISLAKANNASVMLLHVVSDEEIGFSETVPLPVSFGYYGLMPEQIELHQKRKEVYLENNLKSLQSWTEKATAAGVSAEYSMKYGAPGRTICQTASTWDADLIVMGRRGFSGLKEMFMGSVSNYVLHHAHCSVLIEQIDNSPRL